MNLMPKKITNYLYQTESKLFTKLDCMLTLSMEEYTNDDNLRIDEDKIWVSSLISKVEFSDISFNIILDYPVNIQYEEDQIQQTKDYIKIKYNKDDQILDTISDTEQMKKQVQYVERLISGKEVYSGVEHLLQKLYKVYEKNSNFDLVHFEVLLSQCLRDKSNLTLLARLGKTWNPQLINIKKVVMNSGFISSLCFENIGSAIQVGLTGGETLEPSVIEKILTGTLVESKKKK